MIDRKFSERAVHRLRIAARLLLWPGAGTVLTAEQCATLLAVILRLPPARRERLRGLVDWVEDYERAEARTECSNLRLRTGQTLTGAPSDRRPSARAGGAVVGDRGEQVVVVRPLAFGAGGQLLEVRAQRLDTAHPIHA